MASVIFAIPVLLAAAQAATEDEVPPANAPPGDELIFVTGTRIQAPNRTSASAVETLRKDDFTLTGVPNVEQTLNQLPQIKPALLTGMVLSFAHTIGEFGLVLMIGGNIPGQTRVASIAIYNEVETLNYTAAHTYSLVLLLLAFSILLSVYLINKKLVRTT